MSDLTAHSPESLHGTRKPHPSTHRQALIKVPSLIQRYRLKIAQYFCGNVPSASPSTALLVAHLRKSEQQRSLAIGKKFGLLPKNILSTVEATRTWFDAQMDQEALQIFAGLALLRDRFIFCRAFDSLADAMRRTLNYDGEIQKGNLREWLWNGDLPEDHRSIATFDISWPIVDIMRSQYGANFANVGAVITLTGTTLNAQATTCAEYFKTTWPVTGTVLLDLLETGLSKLRHAHQPTTKLVSVRSEQGLSIRGLKARKILIQLQHSHRPM
jgi:hypothetical protein